MNELLVKNFKCFQEQRISFAPLTLLVGGNGSGKSTVIQSLVIFRKSLEKENGHGEVQVGLNNEYALQLGLARYVISSQATDNFIEMAARNTEGHETAIRYRLNEDLDPLSLTGAFSIWNEEGPMKKSFRYLNAERVGPRKVQEMAPTNDLHLGWHGEYTNHIIYNADKAKRHVHELLQLERSPRFSHQVEAWLKTIIPSTQIRLKTIEEAGVASLQYQNERLGTDFYNPPNTGFGITYVLPILVAALLSSTEEDAVLVVENPEAHLHPLGQSRIGSFLSLVAHSGVQVIVETHSEHVVNGARLQLAKMKATDRMLINFFSQSNNKVSIEEVELSQYGEMAPWPPGFMDQDRKDLRELLGIKRKGTVEHETKSLPL